jgi:SAM-dependent methyltransferase
MTAEGTTVHRAAAEGFGHNAADYERGRPEYPAEAISFLAARLDLVPGRTVVDVGAGTGKLTRLLVPTGATVVAIEPVEAMRAELVRVLPELTVHDATAGDLPFGPASVDAITCAQAFHWFGTVGVLHEFARVLKPGRGLALIWNHRDMDVAWVREFTGLLREYEGDRPDHNEGGWRAAFDGDAPFTALRTTTFSYEQSLTPELLVARAASLSFIGALDEATRADVLAHILRLGQAQGQQFVLPYRTNVHLSVRR